MLSSGRVAAIKSETMRHVSETRPAIARALNWTALVDQAILREWLASAGQRDALARIAHLFCELWLRVNSCGLVRGQSIALPLTQGDMGDALGLTSVHVNRQLQQMRKAGMITLERQMLTIHDLPQLASLCAFDPSYLQIGEEAADLVNPK
jgi:CRP-like cAMP-binding protein